MAEEVKTKTTKTKVEKEEVVSAPVAVSETVEAAEEPVAEAVVEQTPAPEPAVIKAEKKSVTAETVTSNDDESDDVEVMGRRGRKSKAQLRDQYAHELTIKVSNEPWKADVYREEYQEKINSLK